MSRVIISPGQTATAAPRVRVDGCPRCGRPIQLNHIVTTEDDGDQYVDLGAVAFAQALHLANCPG